MPPTEKRADKPASGLVNSMASVLGLTIPLALFFVVTPFLVNRLGLEQFGVLTLFMAAIAVMNSLDLGFGAGAVRSLGTAYGGGGNPLFVGVLRQWWSAYFFLGLAAALLLVIAAPFFGRALGIHQTMAHETGRVTVYAFSATVLFGYVGAACQLVARVKERFLGITLIQVISGVLLWLGIALVVAFDGGLEGIFVWIACLTGITFLMQAVWAGRSIEGMTWCPTMSLPAVRASMHYCLRAFWGQLAGSATYQADKFIVSHYLGPASIGHYGIATNLSSKLLMLVASVAGFVFPRIVRLSSSGDDEGVRTTYLRASRYVLLVSWPLFVIGVALAKPFIERWLGVSAAESMVIPLIILLVAYFVNSLSVVASNVFNGIGNATVGAWFSTSGALVGAVMCVLLTPWLGLPGAALASLIASLQVFLFKALLHRRLAIGLFPMAGFWLRLIVAGALQLVVIRAGMPLTGDWPGIFAVGFAALACFYIAWFGLRLADEGDRYLAVRAFASISKRFFQRRPAQ